MLFWLIQDVPGILAVSTSPPGGNLVDDSPPLQVERPLAVNNVGNFFGKVEFAPGST